MGYYGIPWLDRFLGTPLEARALDLFERRQHLELAANAAEARLTLPIEADDRDPAAAKAAKEQLRLQSDQLLARMQAELTAASQALEDEFVAYRQAQAYAPDWQAMSKGLGALDDYLVDAELSKALEAGDIDGALNLLEKGAGHKYIRRIPTGDPKRKWTYIYNVTSKHHGKSPQVGEKIKVAHGDKQGHYEVTATHDGHVTMRHDESGHEMRVQKEHVHELFAQEHEEQIDSAHKRLARTAEAAAKHGTEAQKKRAQAALTEHRKKFGYAAAAERAGQEHMTTAKREAAKIYDEGQREREKAAAKEKEGRRYAHLDFPIPGTKMRVEVASDPSITDLSRYKNMMLTVKNSKGKTVAKIQAVSELDELRGELRQTKEHPAIPPAALPAIKAELQAKLRSAEAGETAPKEVSGEMVKLPSGRKISKEDWEKEQASKRAAVSPDTLAEFRTDLAQHLLKISGKNQVRAGQALNNVTLRQILGYRQVEIDAGLEALERTGHVATDEGGEVRLTEKGAKWASSGGDSYDEPTGHVDEATGGRSGKETPPPTEPEPETAKPAGPEDLGPQKIEPAEGRPEKRPNVKELYDLGRGGRVSWTDVRGQKRTAIKKTGGYKGLNDGWTIYDENREMVNSVNTTSKLSELMRQGSGFKTEKGLPRYKTKELIQAATKLKDLEQKISADIERARTSGSADAVREAGVRATEQLKDFSFEVARHDAPGTDTYKRTESTRRESDLRTAVDNLLTGYSAIARANPRSDFKLLRDEAVGKLQGLAAEGKAGPKPEPPSATEQGWTGGAEKTWRDHSVNHDRYVRDDGAVIEVRRKMTDQGNEQSFIRTWAPGERGWTQSSLPRWENVESIARKRGTGWSPFSKRWERDKTATSEAAKTSPVEPTKITPAEPSKPASAESTGATAAPKELDFGGRKRRAADLKKRMESAGYGARVWSAQGDKGDKVRVYLKDADGKDHGWIGVRADGQMVYGDLGRFASHVRRIGKEWSEKTPIAEHAGETTEKSLAGLDALQFYLEEAHFLRGTDEGESLEKSYRAIRGEYEKEYGEGSWEKIKVPKEEKESEAKAEKLPFGSKQKLGPEEHARYTEAKKRLAAKVGMPKEGWGLYGRTILAGLKNKKEGESMSKSDGLNGLQDYLVKAGVMPAPDPDGLPKGEAKMGHTKSSQVDGGSPDGGELDGVGKTSGSGDSAPAKGTGKDGLPQGTSRKQEKWSDDDADEQQQFTDHKKALERTTVARKSLSPAAQREAVAREHAVKVHELRKGEADVRVGGPVHPLSHTAVHGNTDQLASELCKSEFYYGPAPSLSPPGSVLRQSVLCKSEGCQKSYPAALTACPHCGDDTVQSRLLPHGGYLGGSARHTAIVLEKSNAPLLHPAPTEPDLYVPGVNKEG